MELGFQPAMVGREEEFEQLQAYLSKAAEGEGKTVFIAGESGIGKTRLLDELKSTAQSAGFQVLSGNSMYESLTPYMPVLDALRSGGLEFLFAEEMPRVEAVYLVTDTGLLIREVLREETVLDPDLFASMLTAVGNFVKDSLSLLSGEEREEALNTLGYGGYRIIIESGKHTNLAAILTGRENEFLINDMCDILLDVQKYYGSVLAEWDGDDEGLEGVENVLGRLITSGKHDGVHYGKDDPRVRRNLLFENVSLGLMRQAKSAPTLLCIEDLHWADPSSLSLMHYVGRNTRKCSLLILGTYRPEDVSVKEGRPHPLIETMQLMSREDLYKEIELQRLSRVSLTEILSSLLGEVDFDDDFVNQIYDETEGNPLFVIELVKMMMEEKVIESMYGVRARKGY